MTNHHDTLPNGKRFDVWRAKTTFSRTLYVDINASEASDDNAGTKRQPLKTIARAAEILQPGQRVVIAAGIYDQPVRPARGGTSATKMIAYHAAPGAEVILRGSRVAAGPWHPVGKRGRLVKTPLPAEWFDGENPFATPCITDEGFNIMPWAQEYRGTRPFTLGCGLVFQDGQRLAQAPTRNAAAAVPGSYYVSPGGNVLYVHPMSARRQKSSISITTRSQVFAPEHPGLGYIHLHGLTIDHAGNPFPMPQYGALSTTRGHHWLIENCTVRQVNGVGVDIGGQHPSLPQPRVRPGHHIVRGCVIRDCGVCGLQALPCRASLIEDNLLIDNAFHDVERYFECGGIKTHLTVDTLIRRNRAVGTLHGPGIWIDAGNANTRITGNVVADTRTMFGAIFVELSHRVNLVDHNVVWNTDGAGIYEHDCENQVFRDNVIGCSGKQAMWLRGQVTERTTRGGKHTITGNVLIKNATDIDAPGPQRRVVDNRTV